MQSVEGAEIFVFWSASYSASASLRPMRLVEARVLSLAVLHTLRATPPLTRENEPVRNCESVGAFVSFIIVMRRPSSTPYGCGLISFGSSGSVLVDRL